MRLLSTWHIFLVLLMLFGFCLWVMLYVLDIILPARKALNGLIALGIVTGILYYIGRQRRKRMANK